MPEESTRPDQEAEAGKVSVEVILVQAAKNAAAITIEAAEKAAKTTQDAAVAAAVEIKTAGREAAANIREAASELRTASASVHMDRVGAA